MAEAAAKARLYVPHELAGGSTVGVGAAQAHYLKHVLRLVAGAPVKLFNGRDGEWLARIDGLGKGWASLQVVERLRDQAAEPDLWLLFAPIKRARLDFLVQKAVELGVSVLWPVFTAHTDVARVNTERLAANAIEAAEQCERLTVPELRQPARLEHALAGWPEGRRLMVCAESGDATPIHEFLHGEGRDRPWAVLSGPEGGFSEGELDGLRKLPFASHVGLGPRVLRAETAALAALACWQAVLGDWHLRPPRRRQ